MHKKINAALLIMALICFCLMPTLTAHGDSGSRAAGQDKPVEIIVNLAYTLDRLEKTYDMFGKLVEERSNGHIKITRLATGSMGTVNEVIEALQQGTVHVASVGSMELGSASPNSDWIQLPYLFKDFDEVKELYVNGWIGEELAKEYEKVGLILLGLGSDGFRNFATVKKEVRSLKDMQGLKLRVPNAQSILDFYKAQGAMPVIISGGETLMALQQGTVDGLDNSYINTYSIGVWDSIKYLHKIDYSYGAANFLMSKVKWDTLSAEDQALLKECAQEAGNWNLENLITFEQGLINGTIDGVSKKVFIEPTPEFIAEVKKAAQVMWDQALASDRYDHALIERLYNELYLK